MVTLLLMGGGLGGAEGPWDAAPRYRPVVKELGTRVLVNGVPTTGAPLAYCLYLPGDRAEADYLVGSGTVNNVSLVHPVPAVAAGMTPAADRRWYAAFTGSPGALVANRFEPLLSAPVWNAVPAPVRRVVDALGLDDADLVLVSSNLDTGSIAVYFVPAHDRDRGFYQGKRDLLQRYIQVHDMDAELTLGQALSRAGDGIPH